MFGQLSHLARRFLGAVRPGAPDHAEEQWALTKLNDGERALWRRMNNPDRRHAIEVAHKVVAELGATATRPVVAAALLHDVGKVESGLRTPGRVVATVLWAIAPSPWLDSWAKGSHLQRRMAQYRLHPAIGEQLLADAGADPLTSSWAADHHRPAAEWRVPVSVGQVLKACDDD